MACCQLIGIRGTAAESTASTDSISQQECLNVHPLLHSPFTGVKIKDTAAESAASADSLLIKTARVLDFMHPLLL
jgi:hypothetical protein